MDLRVVGAGVGRTGTASLKKALEQLLGAPCYHMYEVFQHPEHIPVWHAAARGEAVNWDLILDGYAAAVDWPVSGFWQELSEQNPNALVVLSYRDPDAWWGSASSTIFPSSASLKDTDRNEWYEMVMAVLDRHFTTQLSDRDACIEAYNRHNELVRRTVPPDRLLVWEAADGWEPLCEALNVPVPDEAFPKVNTKEEFLARIEAAREPAAH